MRATGLFLSCCFPVVSALSQCFPNLTAASDALCCAPPREGSQPVVHTNSLQWTPLRLFDSAATGGKLFANQFPSSLEATLGNVKALHDSKWTTREPRLWENTAPCNSGLGELRAIESQEALGKQGKQFVPHCRKHRLPGRKEMTTELSNWAGKRLAMFAKGFHIRVWENPNWPAKGGGGWMWLQSLHGMERPGCAQDAPCWHSAWAGFH